MRPRVLVARLDNTGDVLLAGPAVRAIASSASHVTFVASSAGAAAAAMLPGVDDVVTFDAPWVGYEPPPVRAPAIDAFVARIREARPERAIVLTSSHQSPLPLALLLRCAGVPWIAAISRDYPGALLDVRLGEPGDVHEVERALAVAAAGGFALPPGDDGRLRVAPLADRPMPFARPFVVVHPGASVPARRIPFATARGLLYLLAADGIAVAVTGTGAERRVAERLAAGVPDAAVVAGETDLAELAAVCAGAAAVVTGNTGPAHLAAAVGTPVVSVFAPVVPAARWRPWRVAHVLLGDQRVPCAGCRATRCPVAGQPCLAGVTPQVLCDAVHALVPRTAFFADGVLAGEMRGSS